MVRPFHDNRIPHPGDQTGNKAGKYRAGMKAEGPKDTSGGKDLSSDATNASKISSKTEMESPNAYDLCKEKY
jgi:hypothetical protein